MKALELEAGRYDPRLRTLYRSNGAEQRLSPMEGRLLEYLASRPGEAVPYSQLLTEVWGYSAAVESRTVFTTVGRLRQRIECDPTSPRHIFALPGVGYRFEPLDSASSFVSAPLDGTIERALLLSDGTLGDHPSALRRDERSMLLASAEDALSAAIAHRSADEGRSCRFAIHIGPIGAREGERPELLEHLAAITSRLLSVARRGQIVMSAPVRAALPKDPCLVVSCGCWLIRSLAERIELFEASEGEPSGPMEDSEEMCQVVQRGDLWLPSQQLRRHLPAERDLFVGRKGDLLEIGRLFDEGARLVSLAGLGGCGKTRLAARFGWSCLGEFPGGAWFCDLSGARDIGGILSAVARALDVPLSTGDPATQIGWAISGRDRCLVILDNFEQVARHAAETLSLWLDLAENAKFLVTTRELLGLPGEIAFFIEPLPHDEAVALFLQRARAARRDFLPSEADRSAIDELVALLDGLPLAIELCAARIGAFSPPALLARMGDRFRLLASTRGRIERQATLKATLDWSFELLSEDERSAWLQLSVFEGSCALEAAEAALSLREMAPFDALTSLSSKSIVQIVQGERYVLSNNVKAYAVERRSGADLADMAAAEGRHGEYYAAYGSPEALRGARGRPESLRVLLEELQNLAAASRRAAQRGADDVAAANALAAAVAFDLWGPLEAGAELIDEVTRGERRSEMLLAAGRLWRSAGQLDRARARCEEALSLCRAAQDRPGEAEGLHMMGGIYRYQGQMPAAEAHFREALAAYRAASDRYCEGLVLGDLASLCLDQSRRSEAEELLQAALALHRELSDRRSEGIVLGQLGNLRLEQGRSEEAVSLFQSSLALHQESGNRRFEGDALSGLANVYARLGRTADAEPLYRRALALHREVGNRRQEGVVLGSLGILFATRGDHEEGKRLFEAALAAHRATKNRLSEGYALANLGNLCAQQGQLERASELFEAALTLYRAVGLKLAEGVLLNNIASLHLTRDQLSEAEETSRTSEAILRELGARFWLANAMCTRARVLHAAGQLEAARAALGEAQALGEALGLGPGSQLERELDGAVRALATPP